MRWPRAWGNLSALNRPILRMSQALLTAAACKLLTIGYNMGRVRAALRWAAAAHAPQLPMRQGEGYEEPIATDAPGERAPGGHREPAALAQRLWE